MSSMIHRLVLSLAISASLLAPAARADISFVDQFRSVFMTQSGDGPVLATEGYNFSTRLYATSANAYSSVTMTGPGGTVSLGASDATTYLYSSGLFANESAMNAVYPINGTYRYLATGGSGSDSTSLIPGLTDYPQSNPYLTGTSYSRLQGMDASQAIQLTFSPFATGKTADDSFIFFTIFDNTLGASVYDAGFLSASTPGLTLAANLLQSGHSYSYELIFSNRDVVDTTGTEFPAQLGFDYRTSGTFSTAVPEPSSIALVCVGLGVSALAAARRRRA